MSKRFKNYTIIGLLGIYALMLGSNSQLPLYIHPNYINSTLIAAGVCIVIMVMGYAWIVFKYRTQLAKNLTRTKLALGATHHRFKFATLRNLLKDWGERYSFVIVLVVSVVFALVVPLGFILLALVILWRLGSDLPVLNRPVLLDFLVWLFIALGLLLPPTTLSSVTASQRSSSLNSVVFRDNQPTATTIFSFDTDKFDVGDWLRRISANPDLSEYEGKQVNITGFVFQPSEFDQDTFLLSRFLVSCCAVDARPVGIPVYYPGWQDKLKLDEWVRVKGKFVIKDIDGTKALVAETDTTPESIPRPPMPYIY